MKGYPAEPTPTFVETYVDRALSAPQYTLPMPPIQPLDPTGLTCPRCSTRAYELECEEYRRCTDGLEGWVVKVQVCTNTRRQKGTREPVCGWRDKELLRPIPVTSEVVHAFRGEGEKKAMEPPAPSPAPEASLMQQAFKVLMSRPGYDILPLLMTLEARDRDLVYRAMLEIRHQA